MLNPIKILVVDDIKINREVMRDLLLIAEEDNGHRYEVHEAENGAHAVEVSQEVRPQIIFMDVTMPVMDGFEAGRRIQSQQPAAIIVYVSAIIDLEEEVKKSGVIASWMEKPVYLHQFIPDVARLVKQIPPTQFQQAA